MENLEGFPQFYIEISISFHILGAFYISTENVNMSLLVGDKATRQWQIDLYTC